MEHEIILCLLELATVLSMCCVHVVPLRSHNLVVLYAAAQVLGI